MAEDAYRECESWKEIVICYLSIVIYQGKAGRDSPPSLTDDSWQLINDHFFQSLAHVYRQNSRLELPS